MPKGESMEFIKFLVSYAEGFEFKDSMLIYYAPKYTYMMFKYSPQYHVFYPLLLCRAIEGINRKGDYEISIFKDRVYLNDYAKTFGTPYNFIQYGWTIDQAKEQALRYIWEQEQ